MSFLTWKCNWNFKSLVVYFLVNVSVIDLYEKNAPDIL